MSNWITENKPAAIITGSALALVIGLGTFGFLENSKQAETDQKIKTAKNLINAAAKAEFSPTAKTEKDLETSIKSYKKSIANIADSYTAFKASSKLENTTPNAFQNKLNADREEFKKLCASKNIQVNDSSSWFGFQDYGTTAPSTNAAPLLSFELKAINQLATELANNCDLTQFIKISRFKVSAEKPAAAETEEGAEKPAWEPMTIEIAFKGHRLSVMKAINSILNSKGYLFTIDNLRIRNEKVIAPVISAPEKAKEAAPASTGLTLTPTAAASEKESADEVAAPAIEEILKPISGSEQVFAQITVNLIHFNVEEPKSTDSEDAE